MKQLAVTQKDMSVALKQDNSKKKESLSIKGNYPDNALSRFLFSQLALVHLLIPHDPKTVQCNFGISGQTRTLLKEMYGWEKRKLPNIESPLFVPQFDIPRTHDGKVAIAYSGGKDSMWNLWWASEKYGMENVLLIHVKNLNPGQNSEEAKYTERQFKEFGVKNHTIIELSNGSQNNGFAVMRSCDVFLAGISVPVALMFGASRILIEGFAEETDDEYFTGSSSNMRFFNKILKAWHIPVQVAWRNRKEMDCVKDLYHNRPEWMPYVCNCFTRICYKIPHQKRCREKFPTLPPYDSQCGFCIKCRIINIGRILHSPEKIAIQDSIAYLESTRKWIPTKWATHRDMIEGSFLRDFKRACKKYNLPTPSVA